MVLVAMWHASEKRRAYLVIFLIVCYVYGGSSSGAMARMSTNFNGRHHERLRCRYSISAATVGVAIRQ